MQEEQFELLLDKGDAPVLVETECEELKSVIDDFVKSYAANKDQPVKNWLASKLQEQLPDRKPEEVESIAEEIVETIEVNEEKQSSLSKAASIGRSKESWFAAEARQAIAGMSVQESAKYLAGLDAALQQANESLYRTITTKAGSISQNPNLDGFIAEQYHAQTFNLNAEAGGSPYRAKVLEPDAKRYAKNSVDIVIIDEKGKIVRRYQSKYGKDAKATEQAFEHGNYKGQRKLVPEGQEDAIQRKSAIVLEAPDGTTSNPLSKSRAEQMRNEAQSGNWNDLNWNEYAAKDLAMGIGKRAGSAALQGAAIGIGFDVAQKLWNGEEIEVDEVVETAITSGTDFGIKAATAGALKVGVEKEVITVIPKGTPAGTLANIACVAIENVKVLGKMAAGELTVKESIEKLEQTTISTSAGLMSMGKGTAIGAEIGTIFGPVGSAIGGFIGGTIGYMTGAKIGESVVKCAQKVCGAIVTGLGKIASGVGNVFSNLAELIFCWF